MAWIQITGTVIPKSAGWNQNWERCIRQHNLRADCCTVHPV